MQSQRSLDELLAVTDRDMSEAIAEQEGYINYSQARIRFETALLDKLANGDFIKYTLDRVYDYYVEVSPDLDSKSKISIDSGAGNDTVLISQNVPMRTNINGGSGADKLTSGKRTTNLSGGGGDDVLISRSVKGGMLDGGKGSDRYFNRATSGTEVRVMGRNDGDRVIAGGSQVLIRAAGLFGTSTISKQSYLLVDGSDGQIDLLA